MAAGQGPGGMMPTAPGGGQQPVTGAYYAQPGPAQNGMGLPMPPNGPGNPGGQFGTAGQGMPTMQPANGAATPSAQAMQQQLGGPVTGAQPQQFAPAPQAPRAPQAPPATAAPQPMNVTQAPNPQAPGPQVPPAQAPTAMAAWHGSPSPNSNGQWYYQQGPAPTAPPNGIGGTPQYASPGLATAYQQPAPVQQPQQTQQPQLGQPGLNGQPPQSAAQPPQVMQAPPQVMQGPAPVMQPQFAAPPAPAPQAPVAQLPVQQAVQQAPAQQQAPVATSTSPVTAPMPTAPPAAPIPVAPQPQEAPQPAQPQQPLQAEQPQPLAAQPLAAPTAPSRDATTTGPLTTLPANSNSNSDKPLSSSEAPGKTTGAVCGRRAARKPRLSMSAIFADLLDMADIPHSAYAVDEEVTGAMCLFKTDGGYEVFSCGEDARHEVRFFEEEESAYFYLFGVLTAEALRNGRLGPH